MAAPKKSGTVSLDWTARGDGGSWRRTGTRRGRATRGASRGAALGGSGAGGSLIGLVQVKARLGSFTPFPKRRGRPQNPALLTWHQLIKAAIDHTRECDV